MTRLPAALAGVLTIGLCVGFNTVRYPVVRGMLLPTDGAEVASAPAPELVASTELPAVASAKKEPLEPVVRPASPPPAAAPTPQKTQPPLPIATVAQAASQDLAPAQPAAEDPATELVPVVRPEARPSTGTAATTVSVSQPAAAPVSLPPNPEVRRLPPLDQIGSASSGPLEPLASGQLPIYPVTTFAAPVRFTAQ